MARPRTNEIRKILGLPSALAAAVKEYRFERRIETESEAYRQLIRAGLDAASAKVANVGV